MPIPFNEIYSTADTFLFSIPFSPFSARESSHHESHQRPLRAREFLHHEIHQISAE